MKIKAAGTSRLKKSLEANTSTTTTNTIKCPITGKLIPENEFDTHIKTLLRDQDIKRTKKTIYGRISVMHPILQLIKYMKTLNDL